MARVNVETKALSDHRIRLLARKLGTDYFGALGRLVFVWAACVETGRYVLRPDEIDAAADASQLAGWLVEVGLARPEGDGLYVCGTRGHVEWLEHLRQSASSGGKARAASAIRQGGGKFAPANWLAGDQPSHQPSASQRPANRTSAPAPTPALVIPEEAYVDPQEGPRASTPEIHQEGPLEPSGELDPIPGPSSAQNAARARNEAFRAKVAGEAASYIDWLNRNFDRALDPAGKGIQALVGRLVRKHRATQEEMRLVSWHLRGKWLGDPKMEGYLEPATMLASDKWLLRLDEAREHRGRNGQGGKPALPAPVLAFALGVQK